MSNENLEPFKLNELHQNVQFADYRRADGINASGLKEVLRSPLHFKVMSEQPEKEPTDAMRIGHITHCAILEPERFEFCRTQMPVFDRRSIKGREEMAKWTAEQPEHAIVLLPSDAPRIDAMVASAKSHPVLSKMLRKGKGEASVWWQDPKHQVKCKARLDFVCSNRVILDLKTCKDARPEAFSRDIVSFRYDLQAAHYLAAGRVTGEYSDQHYIWVAMEKEPPYAIAIYSASEATLLMGDQWREHAMAQFAQAHASGLWKAYPHEIREIDLPRWASLPDLGQIL